MEGWCLLLCCSQLCFKISNLWFGLCNFWIFTWLRHLALVGCLGFVSNAALCFYDCFTKLSCMHFHFEGLIAFFAVLGNIDFLFSNRRLSSVFIKHLDSNESSLFKVNTILFVKMARVAECSTDIDLIGFKIKIEWITFPLHRSPFKSDSKFDLLWGMHGERKDSEREVKLDFLSSDLVQKVHDKI